MIARAGQLWRLVTRVVVTTLGVSVAAALLPALPSQASEQTREPVAVTDGASTAWNVSSHAGKPDISENDLVVSSGRQVLVAEGDGWSLYVETTEGDVFPMTVVDCGIVTCSVYLSRAQTRSANNNINALGGGIAGLAAACGAISLMGGPAAPVIAVACGVEIAVMGGFLLNAISNAARTNGCLRIRYGALPTAFYNDHSSFCRDT
jgi:hypothetical protein